MSHQALWLFIYSGRSEGLTGLGIHQWPLPSAGFCSFLWGWDCLLLIEPQRLVRKCLVTSPCSTTANQLLLARFLRCQGLSCSILVSDSMWRGHHSGGKSHCPVPRGVKLALQISHWPLAGVSPYSVSAGGRVPQMD